MDCAAGKFPFALSDWIADQFLSGKLRYFALAPNTCYKYLLKLGMPKKDHKWVRLAIGCGGKIIITDDVDFFDPSKKRSDAATKEKIKINGNGPCSKNLRLEYGVEVVTL